MTTVVKILAIDEQEIILSSIARALRSAGDVRYSVATAQNAMDGLRLIRSDTYDLVFVDASLPGMSTLETLRRIRSTSQKSSLILMSGYISGTSIPGEASGYVDAILSKPFTTEEITSLVSRILVERGGKGK